MPRYSLSKLALSDLHAIAAYTLKEWGAAQMRRYQGSIYRCFELLAENRSAGRPCDDIRPGLRRHEHEKHVVFYRLRPDGTIRVSRILHQSRLPYQVRFPR